MPIIKQYSVSPRLQGKKVRGTSWLSAWESDFASSNVAWNKEMS